MIKQECIGIPDMILLLMIFCFKKIKIKAEIVLSPGGAYFLHIIRQRTASEEMQVQNLCNNYLTRQKLPVFFPRCPLPGEHK